MFKNVRHCLGKGRLSNETFINLFMIGVLLVVFSVACVFVPNFFTARNVLNLITNNWYIVMLGIGATFLLITGHMDMSIGGIIAMTGVLSVYFCQSTNGSQPLATGLGLPYGIAVVLALLCAMGIGCINAFFVARLKAASIIITLGTMFISRGVAQIVALGAQRNTSLPECFGVVGNLAIPGTPIKLSVVLMLVLVAAAVLVEKKTVFGRRTYLIGANNQAAQLSGVKVTGHVSTLYIISSLLAGVTGILLASEYKAGLSGRAMGYEFDALVITLLGGTSISGGFGSVLGTLVGALIFSVVTTAATGLLLSPDWSFAIKGIVTFLAIVAQRYALDKRNG